MRKGLLAAILSLSVGSGVALGQESPPAVILPPQSTTSAVVIAGDAPSGSQYGIWGSAEYLLWWTKTNTTQGPLVTTFSGNPLQLNAGGVGVAGTSILADTNELSFGPSSGARFSLGGYLDSEGTVGFEVTGWFLARHSTSSNFASGANGNPSVYAPINITAAALGFATGPNAYTFAAPFVPVPVTGSMNINSWVELWGLEANGLWNLSRRDGFSVDLLGGFRYMNLRDNVSINVQNNFGGGATATLNDSFTARNNFYGGQFGIRAKADMGSFFVDATAKLALGSTQQTSEITGTSTGTGGVAALTAANSGIYAVASNVGNISQNRFSVIPEVEVKLGYNFSERLGAYIGYNFIYWSEVARSGQQIDPNMDIRNSSYLSFGAVPAAGATSSPAPGINNTSFWTQGITFGVSFKF